MKEKVINFISKVIGFIVVYAISAFIAGKLLVGVLSGTLYTAIAYIVIPLFMSIIGWTLIQALVAGIFTFIVVKIVSLFTR